MITELTVPAETNFENANYRKRTKYSDLVDQCQINKWKVQLFPIEIASTGFVYGSVYKCLKELGMHNKTLKIIVREMSKMAVRCSYAIYLSRKKFDFEKWQMNNPLIVGNRNNITLNSLEGKEMGKEKDSPNAKPISQNGKRVLMKRKRKNCLPRNQRKKILK